MRPAQRRIAMGVLLAAAVLGLAATRSGRTVARCLTGDGLSWVSTAPHDFRAPFFGHTWVGNTGNYIDMEIARFGAYELPVLGAMRDAMAAVAGGAPARAVDIGANIGHHSLFLSGVAAEVIAVEPFPPVIERMRSLLELNHVANVRIHAVGYADAPGSLPFHEPTPTNTGVGTFRDDRATANEAVRELPLVRGDDDLAGVGPVHLIKIDIEGYEKPALAGLAGVLAANRPAVVMELNVSGEAGFKSEAELRAVFPADYAVFRIGEPMRVEWTPPGSVITCAPGRANYHLEPYDMAFDRDGHNLLLLPAEHQAAMERHVVR